jgi:hypothetical protein
MGHGFEGWFGSELDFQDQLQRGLLECPLCSSKHVQKLPSAPRLNLGARSRSHEEVNVSPVGAVPVMQNSVSESKLHSAILKVARQLVQNSEDVGARFGEEARRIFYGEAPARGIRGIASQQEAQSLAEEGIEILAIHLPPGSDETLQ